MKLKGIIIIAAAVIVVALLAVFASMAFVIMDMMSYTATGSETLSPAGNMTGKALVVYNPAISGGAKNAAVTMAGMLKAQGYEVVLAGVRSAAASNVKGYDVIIVGGPVYGANASPSVKSYLGTLKPDAGTKLGVYATGGSPPAVDTPAGILNEVASLPADSTLNVKASMKISGGDDVDKKCAEFVNELLK